MNKLFLLIMLSVILMFGGCEKEFVDYETKLVKGVVTSKDYTPARSWITMVSTGKSVIPIVNTSSEEHTVVVKIKEHGTKKWFYYAEDLYSTYDIGDEIELLATYSKNDDGIVKVRYGY